MYTNTHISLSLAFSFEILDCSEQFVEPYLLHTPAKEALGPCLSLISTNAGYPADFYQCWLPSGAPDASSLSYTQIKKL